MKTRARKQACAFSSRLLLAAVCSALTLCGQAQPTITRQPTNVSVSLGATAQFRVTATTASPPLAYQWRHQDAMLEWATNASLTLTNVQLRDAGPYLATVADANGTTNSVPAMLDVDQTFTKITTGALAADKGHWSGAAWADYDNDGYPDLFIHQYEPAVKEFIYRNNGDGTFTRLTTPIPQGLTPQDAAWGNAWGDYDNDGYLDLFISNSGGKNVLLHNRGDGTFEHIQTGPGGDSSAATAAVWGDFDRDGYLDLFIVNSNEGRSTGVNWLYHNQGNGTFARMLASQVGPIVSGNAFWFMASWVDFDDDGWPDLFAPTENIMAPARNSIAGLYRNLANGSFAAVTNNALVSTNMPSAAHAWADYDNDGRLDLCVAGSGTATLLYHNEGGGTFKLVSGPQVGILASDVSQFGGVAWGDYDNDGFLDLFVAGGCYVSTGSIATQSFLYHNNGDGTFTRVTTGSPANDRAESMGAHWVDYDRDGFLDLFVNHHGNLSLGPNLLYRNNGNSNNWLTVECVGTSSPRFGTGAKVRAKATIRGKEMSQLRLIDAGGTPWGGQSFEAHFGLGDATVVETLRIEWPSGIVQELHNVAAKQHLTVTEPTKLEPKGPGQFAIRSWKGMTFEVQYSTNLTDWSALGAVTNLTGLLEFNDGNAGQQAARFYRAVQQ